MTKRIRIAPLLGGVLLPIGTVAFEVKTHMCAEALFDPLPTAGHIGACLFVPFACSLALLPKLERAPWVSHLLAVAIGVSAFYSLVFAPILPLSLIMIIAYGLGFFGLAPLIALVSATVAFRRRNTRTRPWLGIAIGIAGIVALQTPELVTGYALRLATEATSRPRAIDLLRRFADHDTLLRACYLRGGSGSMGEPLLGAFGSPPSPIEVRPIYYRVTGHAFDQVAPPELRGLDWDRELDMGDSVIRDLSLISSQLDASIDPDAALGYLEWTIVLRNNREWAPLEARAKVALPPGGVVSRLSLWIDGEPREAAFASRSRTTEAYERVVQRKRDPVLVTTAGPDHVSVSCFPVPAKGGEMKLRIGITFPLGLEQLDQGWLRLPAFAERNFTIAPELEHRVWIESRRPLEANIAALKSEESKSKMSDGDTGNVYALRGGLRELDISAANAIVYATRDAPLGEVFAPLGKDEHLQQKLFLASPPPPPSLFIVADTSVDSCVGLRELASALRKKAPETVTLFLADDSSPAGVREHAGREDTIAALESARCAGGQDPVPALEMAWDKAGAVPFAPGSTPVTVLWAQGPLPEVLDESRFTGLVQRFERRSDQISLWAFSMALGSNRVLERLPHAKLWVRRDAVAPDLERFLRLQTTDAPRGARSIERMSGSAGAGKETSKHLVRLWASEEIAKNPNAESAVQLAVEHQIVTPVSGAVVLETREQYEEAGLTPVGSHTVPTVPEPGTWLLLAIAAVFGALYLRRGRRAA